MELKIDKDKVLEAIKECPEFERIARKLWPEELEEKSKFEIGDIVEGTENHDSRFTKGKMGIIKDRVELAADAHFEVEFFENIGGHQVCSCANPGHGWDMPADKLRLIYRPKKI